MARRPDPPDDDDRPPPRKAVPRDLGPARAASTPTPDDEDPEDPETVETPEAVLEQETREADEPPRVAKPLTELSDRALLKKLLRYTEEYQMLAGDASQAAVVRRVELSRLMRAVQNVRDAREPLVEVTVPRSVTGESFVLGPKSYPPGRYIIRASEAQYLLWLISENQRIEMNRLQQNGRNIDLGTIGSRARMARISRDDGKDDWTGRGS